jgi:hypothetical protein
MVRREGLQCHTGVPVHRLGLPGAHAARRSLPTFIGVAITIEGWGTGFDNRVKWKAGPHDFGNSVPFWPSR